METVSIVCCTICFDNLGQTQTDVNPMTTTSNTICGLECGHIFHSDCIAQWFRTSGNGPLKKCPMCQTTFRGIPRVKTLYPSFQAAFAFDDLKRAFNASELERKELKKKLDEKNGECLSLRTEVTNLKRDAFRQPFGSLENIPAAARAHNEVQRSPLDLRKTTMTVVPPRPPVAPRPPVVPLPRTPPTVSAEAPELQIPNAPIRSVRMIQRSATSLNPMSRPPPGSYVNNSTELALSPRTRLTLFRARLNREYRVIPSD